MAAILRSLRVMTFTLLVFTSLIIFSECSLTNNPQPATKIHLIVGGKLDVEAQLLTKMYVLLLRHTGFDVEEKAKLGPNDKVFNAITRGQIDLYPEFTTDGLVRLKIASTHNSRQDYLNIKQGYERKYHITWLDVAPLNDTYAICTVKTTASQLGTSLSQIAPIASKLTGALMQREEELSAHFQKLERDLRNELTMAKLEQSSLYDDKLRKLYDTYLVARQRTGERTEGITYESVAQRIRAQVPALMEKHGARNIEFKVVIKGGKAVLKAIPRT